MTQPGEKLVVVSRLIIGKNALYPRDGEVGRLPVFRTVEEAKAAWPDNEYWEIIVEGTEETETENVNG